MCVRRIECTGLLSSTSDRTFFQHNCIWFASCILLGVEFLILLTSTAVLVLKFIIFQFQKEMFLPWLIAVILLNSWNDVSALDTGHFYSKKLIISRAVILSFDSPKLSYLFLLWLFYLSQISVNKNWIELPWSSHL